MCLLSLMHCKAMKNIGSTSGQRFIPTITLQHNLHLQVKDVITRARYIPKSQYITRPLPRRQNRCPWQSGVPTRPATRLFAAVRKSANPIFSSHSQRTISVGGDEAVTERRRIVWHRTRRRSTATTIGCNVRSEQLKLVNQAMPNTQ